MKGCVEANLLCYRIFKIATDRLVLQETPDSVAEDQLLAHKQTLFEAFKDLSASEQPSIVIEISDDVSLDIKRKHEGDEGTAKRRKFYEDQEHDAAMARTALLPSSAAAMLAFKNEQEKWPVLNGRPYDQFGPPIGLFHLVFNSFHAAMNSPERFHADEGTYTSIKALFKASAGLYNTKDERITAIDVPLFALLGRRFSIVEGQGVKSDGVILQTCGGPTAYVAVREIKNKLGTANADPYNQCSLSYLKYWAGEPQNALRARCYCPSVLLGIAGPWLSVFGGIYLRKAVVQRLTQYVWLGGDSFAEAELLYVSRLFAALKTAIFTLETYYRSLEPSLFCPRRHVAPFRLFKNLSRRRSRIWHALRQVIPENYYTRRSLTTLVISWL
ncbi:uncharacterized protein FIBRA_07833 [Fibroporia radiculosa]|uniref:Fungal-type protein kinase domain-containing protein n=1 Tax=Fibroporia radiculosa TaxID=599839 RepID=J4GVP6_9APHY|nr:uncharacterized protein FIBRA_07833 [Fibroporia radiculosa]CCM05605.1 predicted protein [Fibroporia radiculosa]